MKKKVYSSLLNVERIAKGSKLSRFIHNPVKYAFAIFDRALYYRLTKKGIKTKTSTWGDSMIVNLPAGTDIYLTGGKSHDSEIRLAKFIVKNLNNGDCFIDVGSHFGYYTLLAKECVIPAGKVISIEASPEAFFILRQNTKSAYNIIALKIVAGSENGHSQFYEFPNLYSEYNTVYPEQFAKEKWFSKNVVKKSVVAKYSVDTILKSYNVSPKIIKIDTEGSEYEILKGLYGFLKTNSTAYITMEYLSKLRVNKKHIEAIKFMTLLSYKTHVVTDNGELFHCTDPEEYLLNKQLDSDNIVFFKSC